MSSYLCVKTNNNSVKSYAIKSTANQPYMRVGTGYLPLTSETTTAAGLRVKQGGNNYRIVETYTTTVSTQTSSTNTYTYETSRSSQYDTSSTNTYTYNTSRSSQYNTSSTNTYTYQTESSTMESATASPYENMFQFGFRISTKLSRNSVLISAIMTVSRATTNDSIKTLTDMKQTNTISLAIAGVNVFRISQTTNSNYSNYIISNYTRVRDNNTGVYLTMGASVKIAAHSVSNTYETLPTRVDSTRISSQLVVETVSQVAFNKEMKVTKGTSAQYVDMMSQINQVINEPLDFKKTTESYIYNTYTKNDKTSTSNYTSSRQSDYTTNDKTSTSNYTSSRQSSYTTNDRTSTSNYTTEITVTSG